jgi:YVTN family beta-propeller protein
MRCRMALQELRVDSDIARGERIAEFGQPTHDIFQITFSPDRRWLAFWEPLDQGDQGRVYVASNTQSGVVNVVDVATNTLVESFSVGVRPLGIGIRTWP